MITENQFFRFAGATSLFAEIMNDNSTLDSDEQVGLWMSILIDYGFSAEAIVSIVELVDDTLYRLSPFVDCLMIAVDDIIKKLDTFKLDS